MEGVLWWCLKRAVGHLGNLNAAANLLQGSLNLLCLLLVDVTLDGLWQVLNKLLGL